MRRGSTNSKRTTATMSLRQGSLIKSNNSATLRQNGYVVELARYSVPDQRPTESSNIIQDENLCVHSPKIVPVCLLGAMERVLSQNPSKDVTLIPGLRIVPEDDPILFPHPSGDPELGVALTASVDFAVLYHDRDPQLKGTSHAFISTRPHRLPSLTSAHVLHPCLIQRHSWARTRGSSRRSRRTRRSYRS